MISIRRSGVDAAQQPVARIQETIQVQAAGEHDP